LKVYGVFAGYVKNDIQNTGYEETDYYDSYIRTIVGKHGCSLEFCYKEVLNELNLPLI